MKKLIIILLSILILSFISAVYAASEGDTPPVSVCSDDKNCSFGEFCEFSSCFDASSSLTGIAPQSGVCKQIPQYCPTLYEPVCGCDNKEYPNDCVRQLNKVSKKNDGACSSDDIGKANKTNSTKQTQGYTLLGTSMKDVAYVVLNQYSVSPVIVSALNELNLTYDALYGTNITSANFSNYKMMVVGDGYFSNPSQIPVNNVPAVVVNGDNMPSWGWCRYISKSSQSSPFHVDVVALHKITNGFSFGDVQAYTVKDPDLYSISSTYAFSGIKIAVSKKSNPDDAVIAYAEKGNILTRSGYPNTNVNAKTVFFGINEASYWTTDARQLFKNSVLWVLEKDSFNINIKSGVDLISSPLVLDDSSVASLKLKYLQINSIKTYSGGNLVETSIIENHKGYFIDSSSPFNLELSGENPSGTQTISLNQGMNLVGINSLNNISLSSLPNGIKEVSRRNSDGSYSIATKYILGWHNPDNIILEPGKGYWVKANSQINWSYTA
jgi:hypothetical protein